MDEGGNEGRPACERSGVEWTNTATITERSVPAGDRPTGGIESMDTEMGYICPPDGRRYQHTTDDAAAI